PPSATPLYEASVATEMHLQDLRDAVPTSVEQFIGDHDETPSESRETPRGWIPGGAAPAGWVPGGAAPAGWVPGGWVPGGWVPGGWVPGSPRPGDEGGKDPDEG